MHPVQCTRGRWQAGPGCPMTRCSAPAVAGQSAERGRGPRRRLAAGEASQPKLRAPTRSSHPCDSTPPRYAPYDLTQRAMADWRRCRSGAGHHTPVERGGAITRDSGSYGDQDVCGSEAREGQKRKNQGHQRCGELRRGHSLSDARLGSLGRLTCGKKSRPSVRKQMRSSER